MNRSIFIGLASFGTTILILLNQYAAATTIG